MRKPLTLTVDAWGNVIVARTLGNEGTFLAKLDKEGNLLWQQTIPLQGALEGDELPPGLVGPTAAVATETPRDSVEPLWIDPELEAIQRDLRGPSKLFRGLGIAAILAGLFAFGLAGGAAFRTGAFGQAASTPVTAAAGIRGTTQLKARAAVDSVSFEHDVETVDDTVAATGDTGEATASPDATDPPSETSAIGGDVPTSPASPPIEASPEAEPAPAEAAPTQAETAAEPMPTGTSDEELALIGAAAIRKETLRLLNAGEMDKAAQLGMQLVAAAPSDAFSYLCLGAALQAQGRIAEAASAFRSCVDFAKHGDVDECRALAH